MKIKWKQNTRDTYIGIRQEKWRTKENTGLDVLISHNTQQWQDADWMFEVRCIISDLDLIHPDFFTYPSNTECFGDFKRACFTERVLILWIRVRVSLSLLKTDECDECITHVIPSEWLTHPCSLLFCTLWDVCTLDSLPMQTPMIHDSFIHKKENERVTYEKRELKIERTYMRNFWSLV